MPDNSARPVGYFSVGLFSDTNNCYLYSKPQKSGDSLLVTTSPDGQSFNLETYLSQFTHQKDGKLDVSKIENLKISKSGKDFLATFRQIGQDSLQIAHSSNLLYFKIVSKTQITEPGVIAPDFFHDEKFVMYFGAETIKIATSEDLLNWEIKNTVIEREKNFYGEFPVEIANVFIKPFGILVFYYAYQKGSNFESITLNAVLCDINDPAKIIKRFNNPIWESHKDWKKEQIKPQGIIEFKGKYVSYWQVGSNLYAINHPAIDFSADTVIHNIASPLKRSENNPIIEPNPENKWESRATFNAAAFVDDEKVNIIYRAIGDSDVSVLGYATSTDGIHIDSRHDKPIYEPREAFECSVGHSVHKSYSPFASGGGCYGGCEDPRITKIGDKLYMTYVAYDGQNPPRIALTSIGMDDFNNHNWNWKSPVLISSPTEVNKNACILPEKVNGKYVVFHRVYPDILIDFVDNLDFDGNTWLEGHAKISPRVGFWDSRKVGAGATPIKTDKGWLLIYQAVGDHDSSRYKIGAMLLDLNDPTKVLHRSDEPILEPSESYENEGHKYGVVYPCGAVSLNNQLVVYYGGADTVLCAATANMDDFLHHLTTSEKAKVAPVQYSLNYA